MNERKRIALLYVTNYDNATGFIIYLQNIVKNLKGLDDQFRPELTVLYSANSPLEDLKKIGYPYATYYNIEKPLAVWVRAINKFSRIVLGRPLIRPKVDADFSFPALDFDIIRDVKTRVFWKEDFQENYYPQFFKPGAFQFVKEFFGHLQANPKNLLVLSSHAAGNDFKTFYPTIKNKVHYLRFVSIIPELPENSLDGILDKLKIVKPYFVVSNQFWPHKNHQLVLEAIDKLRQQGKLNFQVVFTGKTTSTRDEAYFPSLVSFINDHDLKEQVVITGFLDREEQLLIMKHALAVIQPSFFEGWSTVIEDGKALGQYILAADIPVNREQLEANASFFDNKNAGELAFVMQEVLENRITRKPLDYSITIENFRKSLVALFELDKVATT